MNENEKHVTLEEIGIDPEEWEHMDDGEREAILTALLNVSLKENGLGWVTVKGVSVCYPMDGE